MARGSPGLRIGECRRASTRILAASWPRRRQLLATSRSRGFGWTREPAEFLSAARQADIGRSSRRPIGPPRGCVTPPGGCPCSGVHTVAVGLERANDSLHHHASLDPRRGLGRSSSAGQANIWQELARIEGRRDPAPGLSGRSGAIRLVSRAGPGRRAWRADRASSLAFGPIGASSLAFGPIGRAAWPSGRSGRAAWPSGRSGEQPGLRADRATSLALGPLRNPGTSSSRMAPGAAGRDSCVQDR